MESQLLAGFITRKEIQDALSMCTSIALLKSPQNEINFFFSTSVIPYSEKPWWEKILASLANCWQITKVFSLSYTEF